MLTRCEAAALKSAMRGEAALTLQIKFFTFTPA
jgi:hypothetical protein